MANRPFPKYAPCAAESKIDELVRLLSPSILQTEYMDAASAARLVATGLNAYVAARNHPKWTDSPILSALPSPDARIKVICAALFDLACNAEYLHGRVTNKNWIYCNRHRGTAASEPVAYYSFLKQCPKCCQDLGLEARLSGAQHKPSSHHIGEITTTAAAFFLTLLGRANTDPLSVGVISKQSHDVDALAWSDDVLVLFEIKASPLVTYPVRVRLGHPYTESGPDLPVELGQHHLVDVDHRSLPVALYLANLDIDVPLGTVNSANWPYDPLTQFVAASDGLMTYVEAWFEVFSAYSIPKILRQGRAVALGYLANGWGDEIDSNKTKAGLGRTDDIKKGTYQLLKFGAYYRDGSPNLPIRGALVANLDPLFMFDDYMAKLVDVRWARSAKFQPSHADPLKLEVYERDLFYLYDAVIAFNRPIYNDPLISDMFSFDKLEAALLDGKLADVLQEWSAP